MDCCVCTLYVWTCMYTVTRMADDWCLCIWIMLVK